MDTPENQAEQEVSLPATDEGPTEAVEIEVPAEEGAVATEEKPDGGDGRAPAEGAATDAEPPKKKDRRTARVEAATRRAVEAETVAERLARENEELRQRMERSGTQAQNADRAALANYERAIKAEEELAQAALRDAISSGDPEKQAAAQTRVAEVAAERTNLNAWKAQQPKAPAKQAPAARTEQPRQPARQEQPQVHPEVQKWVESNPWFNPQSDDFDEEMHEFARGAALTVENRFKCNGRSAEIGTSKAYFDEVQKAVKAEFPDYFSADEPPAREVPPMSRNGLSNVAPASRSTTVTAQRPGPTKITLTAEERVIARNLASSGAITGPNGKRLTAQEAELQYAIQKSRNQTQRSA